MPFRITLVEPNEGSGAKACGAWDKPTRILALGMSGLRQVIEQILVWFGMQSTRHSADLK